MTKNIPAVLSRYLGTYTDGLISSLPAFQGVHTKVYLQY